MTTPKSIAVEIITEIVKWVDKNYQVKLIHGKVPTGIISFEPFVDDVAKVIQSKQAVIDGLKMEVELLEQQVDHSDKSCSIQNDELAKLNALYKRTLHYIISTAGNPDAGEACRLIIKEARTALEEGE